MKTSSKLKTIYEYQEYLSGLYGHMNKQRGSDYLYGYLSRSTAYLGKNLALGKADDQHFLRSLSWLFALANFYSVNSQVSLFSRFPTICPYCLTSPCICFRTNKSPASYIPAYESKRELKALFSSFEHTTDDWSLTKAIHTLSKIYPNNEIIWHHAGPWHLIAKMQEEVGELHEAMSRFATNRKPKSAIDEEVADILAWLLSAWGILFRDRSMDDAFADYYLQDCPVCNLFPCECADRADRAAELIDRGILQSIQSNLHVLEEVLPAARDSLQELQKSIAAATDDESEPTTVHALNLAYPVNAHTHQGQYGRNPDRVAAPYMQWLWALTGQASLERNKRNVGEDQRWYFICRRSGKEKPLNHQYNYSVARQGSLDLSTVEHRDQDEQEKRA